MAEFGLIANGELVRAIAAPSAPSAPEGDWRPFKPSTLPEYDPETEERVEVAPLIEGDGITRRWEVLPLATSRPGSTATPALPDLDMSGGVPQRISLRQFLMAADRSGLLATLEALKANEALPERTRRDIHFFLEYSNFIERNHPLIAALAPMVGVTSEQIDDLFRAASAL